MKMNRGVCVLVALGFASSGCGVSLDQTTESSAAEATDATSPSAAETTAVAIAPPTSTTEAPAPPADIEQTLVRSDDTAALVTLISDPNPDPSPIDGDAVPGRPQARCAVASAQGRENGADLVGCEFDSTEAATTYFQQWAEAIALTNPQWYGQAAAITPVDEASGWTGRTLSVTVPGDDQPRARVDLVQQRGPRLYIVTTTNFDGAPDVAATQAIELAKQQQSFLDELGVDADTPITGKTNPDRSSVRYLTPTWSEFTAAAPAMTGPAEEHIFTRYTGDDGYPGTEIYTRTLTGAEADKWGYRTRFSASIQRYSSIAEAKQAVLESVGLDCVEPPAPLEGSPETVACSTDYRFVVTARHGNYVLTMYAPPEVDVAAAQQAFAAWNNAFIARALPTVEPSAPNTAAPRGANPLPTDQFPTGGYDGNYFRTSISSGVDADGAVTGVYADYDKTPGSGGAPYSDNSYQLRIVSADSEIKPQYVDAELVGSIGEVTADAWTTVIWRSYADSDSSSFEAQMLRLLPSGDRLEVSDNSMYFFPPIEQPDPPFAADGPLLTTIWDSYQEFSLASYTTDPPEMVDARDAARNLIREFTFIGTREVDTVYALVAPDSPAGTVAEWRQRCQTNERSDGSLPAADVQLIAFDSDASASNFVTASTDGIAMTPIEGVDDVEASFSAEAGLVMLRRGKWAVRISSPGRSSWQSEYGSYDTAIPIDRFARYAAEYFATANLA